MHSADGLDAEEIGELVRAARAGKSREFGQLVEAFQRPIYALAYRMLRNHADADDVAAARQVITFDAKLPSHIHPAQHIEWNGTPSVSANYSAFRDAVRARLEALVDELEK